jgi:hypothetical protein
MIGTSDRFASALALSHQVTATATLIAGGVGLVDLPIASGSVNLDGTAATRASLSLDLAIGANDLDLIPDVATDMLAPYGNEIAVRRGLIYTDGTTETVGLGIFRIDEVDIDDGDELRVSISGLDRSAIIIEAVFETSGNVAADTNVADAIEAVIAEVYPVTTDFVDTDVTLPELHYEAGDDRWDFARGCAEAAQCSLYFDGDGTLVMRPLPQALTPVYSITEGEGGTLLGASKRWGRGDACNRVVVTGENASEDPVSGEATDDTPGSPTLYGGPFGRVTFAYSSSFITDNDQADSVAQTILTQKLGTGQQISFDALVNPALEPFDTVGVRREQIGIGGENREELHILDSISVPLTHDGTMTGQTRVARVV